MARSQGKEQTGSGGGIFYNLNAGKWGANYQPDRTQDSVNYRNLWRNVNTRFTWQATPGNKFNIFWDEQDSCQDPVRRHGRVVLVDRIDGGRCTPPEPRRAGVLEQPELEQAAASKAG